MGNGRSHSGVTRGLWRERHPFALLALLLVLMPVLMGPALSTGGPIGFAVCSATGVVPGEGGTPADTAHDGFVCCGTVCAHGCAVAAGADPGRPLARVGHRFAHDLPGAALRTALSCSRFRSIRAPPAAVA